MVASKLLSPTAGVVSGSALLVDYVLTITVSVASGTDALFTVLPAGWLPWKLAFACVGVMFLTLVNLRGVKESVLLWMPVFFVFVGTHGLAILIAIVGHVGELPALVAKTTQEFGHARSELGWLGVLALLLKAYSMGAGTYTGIEAVSNGLPILREPRVATGKRTMTYMGVSLCVVKFHEGGCAVCDRPSSDLKPALAILSSRLGGNLAPPLLPSKRIAPDLRGDRAVSFVPFQSCLPEKASGRLRGCYQ